MEIRIPVSKNSKTLFNINKKGQQLKTTKKITKKMGSGVGGLGGACYIQQLFILLCWGVVESGRAPWGSSKTSLSLWNPRVPSRPGPKSLKAWLRLKKINLFC